MVWRLKYALEINFRYAPFLKVKSLCRGRVEFRFASPPPPDPLETFQTKMAARNGKRYISPVDEKIGN